MLLVHRPLLVAFLAVEMVCRNASVNPKAKAKGRAKGTAQAKSNAAKALTQERKVATRGSALQHVLFERALERLVKRCRDQPLLVSLINEAIDSGALTCATPKHSCRVVFSHSVTYNFQIPKKYIRQLIDEMEKLAPLSVSDTEGWNFWERSYTSLDLLYNMYECIFGAPMPHGIYARDVLVWIELHKWIAHQLGNRFFKLKFPPPNKPIVFDKSFGVYILLPVLADGQPPIEHRYDVIQHISGNIAILYADDGVINGSWIIAENWSDLAATLHNAKKTRNILLKSLFDADVFAPIIEKEHFDLVAHEEKVARNLDAASTAALSDKKQMRGQIL